VISPLIRDEQVDRLADQTFDVAIIGGGINGAAIARDAAMRGLKVAMVDKGDFAGATSSRSSKLIHGGLRYLAQARIRLVREALRERERLRRLAAPHLVWKTRFVIPVYAGGHPKRFSLGAGLMLYDLLAGLPKPERHRNLNADEVEQIEPALKRERLRGGALYYDASTDDARLTWENVLDAAEHGAVIANYAAVKSLAVEQGRVAAAAVRDLSTGKEIDLRARIFVNAAGPWTDEIRRLEDSSSAAMVRLSKGCHLLIEQARIAVHETLALSTPDGRLLFVMPRGNYVLVGTTDTDFIGDQERVSVDAADVEYLLGMLNGFFPGKDLGASDVESSFAGLRALVTGSGDGVPSSVSREEMIHQSRSGMITVAGGKLTTHRAIAERVVDMIRERLGSAAGRCPTLDTPLPGARPIADGRRIAGADRVEKLKELAAESRERLLSRYGTRAPIVAELIETDPELGRPLAPGTEAIGAEVVFAARTEMAITLSDAMLRRIGLAGSPREAKAAAAAAARLMARENGWSVEREQAERRGVLAALDGGRTN
jgi:glycerol-3-phosphate dehydrogenase